MENQETNDQKVKETAPGATELANMDIQCHLLITDSDTGEVLVNQRG